MLQPSEASFRPVETPLGHNVMEQTMQSWGQYLQQGGGSPGGPKKGIWQWITFKEIVFVFLLCSSGAVLFRSKDSIQFNTIWKETIHTGHFTNSKFPVEDEKMPRPVITDLDNDGNMDVLMFTSRTDLKLLTVSSSRNIYKPPDEQHSLSDEGWADMTDFASSDNVRPAAMATGYLQKFQSMVQLRKQVVVVLLSDWTVVCFDHALKLLWKSKMGTSAESWRLPLSEATVLVTSVGIQKGDYGSVIIGGREVEPESAEQSVDRLRRIVDEGNEDRMLSYLGHYTVYALEGRGGVVRWQHTPTDFQQTEAYSTRKSSFRHMKLSMHREAHHAGEVSWHQYSAALRDIMPHSWQHSMDTRFILAHFKKDQRPSEKSELKDHITKVGGLAMDHMAGLTFGGNPPHSATEHVQDPNVLVLHSVKGVEVMHLFQGRPLCTLHLSPFHSSHQDINGDGVIERVSAVHNPGEEVADSQEKEVEDEISCYGMAAPMESKPIFKHSICKATHWTEAFVNMDKWIPNFSKVGRKKVNHRLTETLAPVLIESAYHGNPLKLHMGAPGWDINSVFAIFFGAPGPARQPSLDSFTSPAAKLYDSVFILSSGRVTSIGPHGEFNWQVDCPSDWDIVSQVIYDFSHSWWQEKPEMIQLLQGGFVPSATPFSLQVNGKEDHILLMGWDTLTLLLSEDGAMVTSTKFHKCNPVAPVLVRDFNGDGLNDVVLVCQDKYWGVALHRKSGNWNKTLISAFVGVVIVVVAMYTRQRTIGLLPPVKSD